MPSIEALFLAIQTLAILFGIPVMAFRFGRGTEALAAAMGLLTKEVEQLKNEQKEFRGVLTKLAVQDNRLDNQGQQITALWKLIEDLRRGEGFILPIKPTS